MKNDITEVYLKTPDLSKHNILGSVTGVRPYRKSGVCIKSEYLNNQLIIHNYGYGGSGFALCWGGAQEVIHILNQEKLKNPNLVNLKKVAVLGAGVIGMTTAYDLISQGYEVSIYADDFSPNLTSNVAAGYLGTASAQQASHEQMILLNRMNLVTRSRFLKSVDTINPEFNGVRFIYDYIFDENVFKDPQELTDEIFVNVHFDNHTIKTGRRKKELCLDGSLFMDNLFFHIKNKCALITKQHLKNKNEINELGCPIVINCTSIGSRELFQDNDFIPLRGHLIFFKWQKDINYSVHHPIPADDNYWVMLYPWHNKLILGGVFEKNHEEHEVDPNIINRLLENAHNFFNNTSCQELK